MRFGSCGLRVLPGVKAASSVVTVLPRMIAPASRRRSTTAASFERTPAAVEDGAVLGRQIARVDDVLQPDRHAVQRPGRAAGAAEAIRRLRLPHDVVGIEMRPRLHLRLALGDPRQARLGELDRLDRAARDLVARLKRGEIGEAGAARTPSL